MTFSHFGELVIDMKMLMLTNLQESNLCLPEENIQKVFTKLNIYLSGEKYFKLDSDIQKNLYLPGENESLCFNDNFSQKSCQPSQVNCFLIWLSCEKDSSRILAKRTIFKEVGGFYFLPQHRMPSCGKTIPSREPTEADHEALAELTNFSEKLKKYETRFLAQI